MIIKIIVVPVMVVGNFSKGSNNMKGSDPAVNKRFRRLFKNTWNLFNKWLKNIKVM